jgi:acyl carrier protein
MHSVGRSPQQPYGQKGTIGMVNRLEDSTILEIYQKLTGIFHDVFHEDSIVLNAGLTAADVEDWDSLTHIRLVLAVQNAFRVSFSAAEIGKLKDIGGLVALIQSKR